MRGQRVIVATTVLSAVLAGWLCLVVGWGAPAWWALPALVMAVALAESLSVRLVIGRQGFSFALTDAFVAVGFVLAAGAWITVALVLGLFAVRYRRIPGLKLAFNTTNFAVTSACGVLVTQELGGGIAAACAGLCTFALFNIMLTSLAVSATSGQAYHRVLMQSVGLGTIHTAGNTSVGLLAAWLVAESPMGLLGLVVPMALLWWSYQQQARRAAEARLFEELARGQEKIAGQSIDTSARVVVTAAARLFGGAEVEVLLRSPDGLVRYIGDEHGVRSRVRVEADAFGEPWVLRALAVRGVLTGVEEERPYCSAVMGDPERPRAVLIARRPERAGAFERADERLAETLARQAESWLSVADLTARHDVAMGQVEAYGAASRVLGDIGAHTTPALNVLRESADRLSRLAYAFDGPDPLSEIVDELHAVERAVASLLGAISLSSGGVLDGADADASGGSGSFATPRAEAEWTTTGRLEVTLDR